jgi:glycosyltransferase involved in cell wall biosynthesis
MKILFVSHQGTLGGAERSLLELLECLHARGVQLALACPARSPLSESVTRLGIRVFPLKLCAVRRDSAPIPAAIFLAHWVRVTLRLLRIIWRERVDVVHTNNTVAQLWSWPALRLARCRFVWHWRDFYDYPSLNRWLARGPGVSVAVSRSMRDFAERQVGGAGAVFLVPNGVKPQCAPGGTDAPARWREQHGVQPTDFLAVALGQAIPRKGFLVMIQALALARPRCASLKVFLACQARDEESREHLRQLHALAAEQLCEDRLVLAEEIGQPALALAAADVVVVPSLQEPFGRVSVEAMLAQKPVICSAVGGLTEIVDDGNTGVLVPPGDARQLARALVSMAASPETRRTMGTRGRRRALEEFPIGRTVEAVLGVYERLMVVAR